MLINVLLGSMLYLDKSLRALVYPFTKSYIDGLKKRRFLRASFFLLSNHWIFVNSLLLKPARMDVSSDDF